MESEYPRDWDSRREKVYKRDDYTCQNCGATGGPKGDAELHAHHGVPISKGGTHRLSNLTTYCKECHNAIHGDQQAPRGHSDAEATIDSDGPPELLLGIGAGALLLVVS